MDITWKYKIDLVDEKVFSEIGAERGITIPDELKRLVTEGNAATPDKYKYIIGSTEKVVGAILSFNRDEKEADSVYTALDVIDDRNLMPFAIDSFGNYICLELNSNNVVFWDHETGDIFTTGKGIDAFMESLY